MALTGHEANDSVANSRGISSWHRAVGVLRVVLRKETEEQAGRRDQPRVS